MYGVSIGGVQWKVGSHSIYKEGDATCFGTVTSMFFGKDHMTDKFVIFRVQRKRIRAVMGHFCMLSDNPSTSVYVLWSQITWKCMLLQGQGGAMVLPFKSTTSHELIEL
jgi:hypothetical protein